MSEVIFLITESEEGGYLAKCLTESIFTEGNDMAELKENIREAVLVHYDEDALPKIVRLHFVKDEVLAI